MRARTTTSVSSTIRMMLKLASARGFHVSQSAR
jgi:hypothetical protein